jgi:hypothetical protein
MGLSNDPRWHGSKYGERVCKICGKTYLAHAANQKTCSKECAKELQKALEKKWESDYRLPSFKKPEPEQKQRKKLAKKKQLSVVEIAVLARQEGMTYGQYVAMHDV